MEKHKEIIRKVPMKMTHPAKKPVGRNSGMLPGVLPTKLVSYFGW
jgi:hypothetical protein